MLNEGDERSIRMGARYLQLLASLRIAQDTADSFGVLVSRYSAPHRKYHNLSHIEDCLAKFEAMRRLTENDVAVELAVWFHDIVYDPLSRTNEEDSAVAFRQIMAPYALPEALCQQVAGLIVSTKHSSIPDTIDAAILHDADLSILGADHVVYSDYYRRIRAEYGGFTDESYREGRSLFLRKMLAMGWIFCTGPGRDGFERRARENMSKELTSLEL